MKGGGGNEIKGKEKKIKFEFTQSNAILDTHKHSPGHLTLILQTHSGTAWNRNAHKTSDFFRLNSSI